MLKQSAIVAPPLPTDSRLTNYSQIIQRGIAELYQAAHVHKIVTAAPAAKDGMIGDIYIVTTSSDTYLTIKTSVGWASQSSASSSSSYINPTLHIAPIRPENFACAASTGGSLASATYIYKIYPFDKNDFVGIGSPETTVVVSGANHSVIMTWTASPTASYYKIQRSTGSGTYDGWFRVSGSTVTFTDSGQSFDGAPPIIVASNQLMISMGGGLQLPAGIGSIQWLNYTTGTIGASVGATSAGELEFVSGDGNYRGHYYFDKYDASALSITLDTSETNYGGPAVLFGDGSANREGYLSGIKLHFYINGAEKMILDTTNLTLNVVPKFAGTNTTGAKTATLGTNGPMVTTTPYTWMQVVTADGSTGYIPIWK